MGNSSSSKKDTILLSTEDLIPIRVTSDVLKLVVLGTSKVGKSSLITQYVAGHFIEQWEPTVEDSYRKTAFVDNQNVLLEILDTTGTVEFQVMMDQYMRLGNGFLVVYSVTDRQSFDQCAEIYKQILRVKDVDSAPIVLIGNKSDDEKERQVPTAHGEELAKQLRCPFFETSAKNNVDRVFDQMIRLFWKHSHASHGAPGGGGVLAITKIKRPAKNSFETTTLMGNSSDKEKEKQADPKETTTVNLEIAVLGPEKCGKSKLIERYIMNRYIESHDRIVEDSHIKELTIFTFNVRAEIVDAYSRPDMLIMTDQMIKNARGLILVYDITNDQSLNLLMDTFYERIKIQRPTDYMKMPIMLVGTKSDSQNRAIPHATGEELANKHKWMFTEASARTGDNVNLAFYKLIQTIMSV